MGFSSAFSPSLGASRAGTAGRLVLAAMLLLAAPGFAQQQLPPRPQQPVAPPAPVAQPALPPANYIVGPQDVLAITSYDQPNLSGRFAVEADGTFTFPLIGRVTAGGLTLRQIEDQVKKQLIDQGFFRNPQITVAIEQYRSQKIFIVGEVRNPGAYPLTGDMRLVEALALAGSTLPTASGEAVIMHRSNQAVVVESAEKVDAGAAATHPQGSENLIRVNLRELEQGVISHNVALRDGDTIFVLRAESIYVFGQVRNPGAYPLQQRNTTVLQALALAGGVTDRGATTRIDIIRIVNGEKREIRVRLTDFVLPGDTIIVPERFF